MASSAAEVADPLLPFVLQLGIVHESSIGIRTGLLLLQRDEIGGYVRCILLCQPQAGHDSHVLDLQLMAIVRALAMLQVEDKGQTLLGIIFRTDDLLLQRTIGSRALARVV